MLQLCGAFRCIFLLGRIICHQTHSKNECTRALEDWRGTPGAWSGLVDHCHPAVKCWGGFWGEKIDSCWKLIVYQLQKVRLGVSQGEWNIDQLWFRCRNVLGRHGKVRGAVGTWDSSHGQNSSPREGREKRECAQKGRKGPLASKCTYFASSYSHFQGQLEGKKKWWGHVWLFQPPKLY